MDLDSLFDKGFDFIIKVLIALIILLIGLRIIKVFENNLKKPHKFNKMDASVKTFLISIITIILKVLLVIIVASMLGVPTTSIITVLGSCTLAVGLALQGGLSNLAGGVMILIFKPFKVGDYIKSNEIEGTVNSITIFYTRLTTLDNKEVMFPNGSLTNNVIVNYSVNNIRRLDLEFSVSYDSKIDKVKKVLNTVINKNNYILKDKDIVVRLLRHDSSALTFIVRVYVNSCDYFNALYDLEEDVKNAFDKNNIEIPYNQLDVHMK